jgi:two-component system chemotaxis sensor kinase CheA
MAPDAHRALCEAVARKAPHAEIARIVVELGYESGTRALARVGDQARALALRLGRGAITVDIEGEGVRFDPVRFRPFWSSFVHAVRNAIDHGIEPPQERIAAGKDPAGRIRLSMTSTHAEIIVELADDGRGIDWVLVAKKAMLAGLPHDRPEDLVAALFADGISTRSDTSELSGRGVGLAALRATAQELGGRVEITSSAGAGTTLRVRFARESPLARAA